MSAPAATPSPVVTPAKKDKKAEKAAQKDDKNDNAAAKKDDKAAKSVFFSLAPPPLRADLIVCSLHPLSFVCRTEKKPADGEAHDAAVCLFVLCCWLCSFWCVSFVLCLVGAVL